MQYILTPEEYNGLVNARKAVREEVRNELQKLCTEVATHKPVERPWSKGSPATPWGCIREKDGPKYCDCCPVKDLCPHAYKNWSK